LSATCAINWQKNEDRKIENGAFSCFFCPHFSAGLPAFSCPPSCLIHQLKNFRGGSSSRPVFTLTQTRAAQKAGCQGFEQELKTKGELV